VPDAPPLPGYYRHKQLGHVIAVEMRYVGQEEWLAGRDVKTGKRSAAPASMLVRLSPDEVRRIAIRPVKG